MRSECEREWSEDWIIMISLKFTHADLNGASGFVVLRISSSRRGVRGRTRRKAIPRADAADRSGLEALVS